MTQPSLSLGFAGWQLRPWREADAPSLAEHANNPAVWRWMSDRFPHPYTIEIAEHWVRQGHLDFGGRHWAVAHDGLAVGGCGVNAGNAEHACNAEIGYWLAEPYWGRGIGRAIVGALATQAFADPGVTRVYAPVHAGNVRSARVLVNNGFVLEGVLRRSALKAGRVVDTMLYGRYREAD